MSSWTLCTVTILSRDFFYELRSKKSAEPPGQGDPSRKDFSILRQMALRSKRAAEINGLESPGHVQYQI